MLKRAGFTPAGELQGRTVYSNPLAMYTQRSGISGFCLLTYGPRLYAPADGDFHLWLNHEMIQTLEIHRQTHVSLQQRPQIERIDRLVSRVKTILYQGPHPFSGPLPSTEILREYNDLVAPKFERSLSLGNLKLLEAEDGVDSDTDSFVDNGSELEAAELLEPAIAYATTFGSVEEEYEFDLGPQSLFQRVLIMLETLLSFVPAA